MSEKKMRQAVETGSTTRVIERVFPTGTRELHRDGVVYEKNLGKETEKIATAMKVFDPDKT